MTSNHGNIQKIASLKNIGVFKDFNWDDTTVANNGSSAAFGHINIIYGRNYSGKTTLSRIFRALETGHLSGGYKNPDFVLELKSGDTIRYADLTDQNLQIRVFNQDFVRENLRFIHDPNDTISSFAVVGDKNIQVQREIDELTEKLGQDQAEASTGLFKSRFTAKKLHKDAISRHKNLNDTITAELRKVASTDEKSIRNQPRLYGDQNYNINKLKKEIKRVQAFSDGFLSPQQEVDLESVATRSPKSKIERIQMPELDLQTVVEEAKSLVEIELVSSDKISEFLLNPNLHKWAEEGIHLHENQRDSCRFCGNTLSDARWNALKSHFDATSTTLKQNLIKLNKRITSHRAQFEKFCQKPVNVRDFYDTFGDRLNTLQTRLDEISDSYIEVLDQISDQVTTRADNIFQASAFALSDQDFSELKDIINGYNHLIDECNKDTLNIEDKRKEAQEKLRLNRVRKFIDEHDYPKKLAELQACEIVINNAYTDVVEINAEIRDVEKTIGAKRSELRDEAAAIRLVNGYLAHCFGYPHLELRQHETSDEKTHFDVYRAEHRAENLSEGECSIIAFCYFLARLQDDETKDTNPIIWIDDPISSLDSNHIFSVHSLIAAEIVEKDAFSQLFISTHNLEFLKYLKRLPTKPGDDDSVRAYFMLERNHDESMLKPMPTYLKKYVTEFNWLFHQIYLCAHDEGMNETNFYRFQCFGNNARKFLEIYLFYKYPNAEKPLNNLSKWFGEDMSRTAIYRMVNELSHLTSLLERGAQSFDVPEIQQTAKLILDKIKERDADQYQALMKSIGGAK